MRQAAVALRVELHALAQHGTIVRQLRGLHQGGQREHAHAAGDGEEGDDGGEASHTKKRNEGTLQEQPDPAGLLLRFLIKCWPDPS